MVTCIIRNEIAFYLGIDLLQTILVSDWKSYLENLYVCMWHQSYMRPYSRKIFRSYIKAGNSLPDFCTTFSSACK